MKTTAKAFTAFVSALLVLTSAAFAQTFTFKAGDNVETLHNSKWYRGKVTGHYADMYIVKVAELGLKLYPEENEIRAGGSPINNPAQNNSTPTGAPATAPEPCEDWCARSIMQRDVFLALLKEKYGNGFDIPTNQLIYHVKTRKVDFTLTADDIARINVVRNAPVLIQAARDNYEGEKFHNRAKN